MNISIRRLRNGLFAIIAAAIGLSISPAANISIVSTQAKAESIFDVFKPKASRKKTVRTRRAAPRKQSQRPRQTPAPTSTTKAPEIPALIPVPQPRPGSEEKAQPEKARSEPEQPKPEPKEPAPAATPQKMPEEEKPPLPPTSPAKPDEAAPLEEKADDTRDKRVYQVACPALLNGEVQGKLVAPLADNECGERSPLQLTAIGKDNPLPFAAPITTNCAMAVTLAQWAKEVHTAALKSFGAEIESIATGSDYQCRKVNRGLTGRTSEHAFANALDIMSFRLKNGQTTELTSGWNGKPEEKEFWRAVHKTSCDMFMTVIGPDGDAAHKTNLHLDQGCHGKDCTARICQ